MNQRVSVVYIYYLWHPWVLHNAVSHVRTVCTCVSQPRVSFLLVPSSFFFTCTTNILLEVRLNMRQDFVITLVYPKNDRAPFIPCRNWNDLNLEWMMHAFPLSAFHLSPHFGSCSSSFSSAWEIIVQDWGCSSCLLSIVNSLAPARCRDYVLASLDPKEATNGSDECVTIPVSVSSLCRLCKNWVHIFSLSLESVCFF